MPRPTRRSPTEEKFLIGAEQFGKGRRLVLHENHRLEFNQLVEELEDLSFQRGKFLRGFTHASRLLTLVYAMPYRTRMVHMRDVLKALHDKAKQQMPDADHSSEEYRNNVRKFLETEESRAALSAAYNHPEVKQKIRDLKKAFENVRLIAWHET